MHENVASASLAENGLIKSRADSIWISVGRSNISGFPSTVVYAHQLSTNQKRVSNVSSWADHSLMLIA
jgi:hypothetical protein